jgi:hypothetical protein
MYDLKIFIDEAHPFKDEMYPLVIQVCYAGQKRLIRTPYRFVRNLSCNIELDGIHYRSMSVVENTQEEVQLYVAGALTKIKRIMAQLEASGEEHQIEDILRLNQENY